MNQGNLPERPDNTASKQGAAMDRNRIEAQLKCMRDAPRCGAKTRAGGQCQCPAVCGRMRCRIHGGLSPGAPRGEGNGNFKDGFWTAEATEERRWVQTALERYAKGTD